MNLNAGWSWKSSIPASQVRSVQPVSPDWSTTSCGSTSTRVPRSWQTTFSPSPPTKSSLSVGVPAITTLSNRPENQALIGQGKKWLLSNPSKELTLYDYNMKIQCLRAGWTIIALYALRILPLVWSDLHVLILDIVMLVCVHKRTYYIKWICLYVIHLIKEVFE